MRNSYRFNPIWERFYTKIPSTPNELKYGKEYRKNLNFLNKSQWYELKELREFQFNQFKKLLLHAKENIPYYRQLFQTEKINIESFQRLEDIKKIPLLTKEIIREKKDLLISAKHKDKLRYISTSGSTGTPLSFFWQKGFTDEIENAFLWHLWGLKNIKPYDRFIILRGHIIGDRIFKYRKNNKLVINSYLLNKSNLNAIINEIENFKPQVIQAYPSALFLLTNLFIRNNYKFPFKVKAILTSSENLYRFQEEIFNKYFNVQVYDLYGNSERTVLIHRCEKNTYHIIPQYAFTEVIKLGTENVWCSESDERGFIVSTPFNNYAMPLIRYKTDDIIVYGKEKCICGRNYETIKNIEGREQEYFIRKDKSLLSLDMVTASVHSNIFEKVEKFQFLQENPGEIDFKIIAKNNLTDAEKKAILNELGNKLGKDTKINLKIVDEIPLSPRGKYKLLIQKFPISF